MSALQELQNYTFISKYARYLPDEKRRETWREAVERVKTMMLEKYSDYPEVHQDIDWAYDMMLKKKVLGSQRALQYGGKPCLDKNIRIYNCAATYADRPRVFQECLFALLAGVGIGVSIQKQHVNKLPKLQKGVIHKKTRVYVIPDSCEGWSDALGILLTTYFTKPADPSFKEWLDYNVKFDYSQIRPKGSPLSHHVGKAPGPDGLHNSLDQIRRFLESLKDQDRLRPIDVNDIICHASDAVLSGGIRRSACLFLFDKDDKEMMGAKTGNWNYTHPHRARSNNSIALLRNKTTFKEFENITKYIKEFGEPGYYWTDSLEVVPNPCIELSAYPQINGKSGFQMCNLSSINCGNLKNEEDFYERCKAASIIGTIQAGFTNFKYMTNTTKQICEKEALLGVSMTGMMTHPEIVLDEKIQRRGAKIVKETNKTIANKININQSARTTLLKPEGTTSTLLGTSSGLHPHYSKRYLRRVQVNKEEGPYHIFQKYNNTACEESIWSNNRTDDVISFPIEVQDGAKLKNMISAVEFLETIKITQQNWIAYGKNKELCSIPELEHSVSNTVKVCDDEWDEVIKYIYKNRKYFTGITLLAESGDKDYFQAPFLAVKTSHEIVSQYGNAAVWCSGLIELALQAFDNGIKSESAALWRACDAVLNDNFDPYAQNGHKPTSDDLLQYHLQTKFWEKARKFATKYFEGNVKRLTYCIKDVHSWKTYCDLSDNFKEVDYSQLVEYEDNTKIEETVACAGGACEI